MWDFGSSVRASTRAETVLDSAFLSEMALDITFSFSPFFSHHDIKWNKPQTTISSNSFLRLPITTALIQRQTQSACVAQTYWLTTPVANHLVRIMFARSGSLAPVCSNQKWYKARRWLPRMLSSTWTMASDQKHSYRCQQNSMITLQLHYHRCRLRPKVPTLKITAWRTSITSEFKNWCCFVLKLVLLSIPPISFARPQAT